MYELPAYQIILIASVVFSLGNHLQALGVSLGPAARGSTIMVISAAVVYWLFAPVLLNVHYVREPATYYFVAVGLFLPAVTMSLSVVGVRLLGATLQASLASTAPVFAALIGIVVLGETLTWPMAAGIAGIMCAALILHSRRSPTTNWPRWAVVFPFGMVTIRVLGQAVTKIGLVTVPDPYYATLVSATTSAFVLFILYVVRHRKMISVPFDRGTLAFVGAGCCLSGGFFLVNAALFRGNLIEVVPVLSVVPIFSILWSVLVFKKETLDARFLAAVVVVAASVATIAANR